MKNLKTYLKNIKLFLIKALKIIGEFIHYNQELVFLFTSITIIIVSICLYNSSIISEDYNNYNSSPVKQLEDDDILIRLDTKNMDNFYDKTSPILNYIFKDKCYNYTKLRITDSNSLQFTIKYDDLGLLYKSRNTDIEKEMISVYKQIKAMLNVYKYHDIDVLLTIEDTLDDEFVYFIVECGAVSWTCHDDQIIWYEGYEYQDDDDIIEYDLSEDKEYLNYIYWITELKGHSEI